MPDQKRGDDAADHAPKTPTPQDKSKMPTSDKQDAPNYADTVDKGLAEPVEAINSANDGGAA